MRSEMFFPKNDEDTSGDIITNDTSGIITNDSSSIITNDSSSIISKDKPISYDHKKNITLSREIKDYDELSEFISEHNKMSSGNYTLLPKDEIERFNRFGLLSILMRGGEKLYGTIFSIPLSIRSNNEMIDHGCTSFLNVHSKIRGFNMCMILIRELANYGYENNIYCSYQLSSFKMCDKSFQISSWYRPINLMTSLGLGFLYPGYNEIKEFTKNRILYKCKSPKGYSIKKINKNNKDKAYEFYNLLIENKKFVFSPDMKTFSKWVEEFPTYLVSSSNKNVGIFSITSIFCKMNLGMEGKLCLPIIFHTLNKDINVIKCLLKIAEENGYDLLYTHSVGDLDEETLKNLNFIQTREKSWFSIYNNSIDLKSTDLYIPLL